MTTNSGSSPQSPDKKTTSQFYIRLLYLFVVLAVFVTIVVLEGQRRRQPKAPLFDVGDIDALEVRWKSQSARLVRLAGGSAGQEGPQWQVTSIQDKPLVNVRGNQGFISHFVDLLKNATVQQGDIIEMSEKDAPAYGLVDPALAVNLSWKIPSPGEEVVLFGNTDLTGKLVYVFFPRGPKLMKSPATIYKLLESKTVDDFRDRHLITFKTDDVEELRTEGICGALSLWRNGDHWEWRKGQELEDTDAWLDILTAQTFLEETPGASGTLWCTLEFTGRLGRAETLRVYEDSAHALTAVNSALPGYYKIPGEFTAALKISKGMVRRPRPRPTPSAGASPSPSPSASP